MLVSGQLIKNLKGKVNYTLPLKDVSPMERLRWFMGGIKIHDGLRHESLKSAEELLQGKGRSLDSFKKIVTVIRNPYDHAVSRYHYLKQVRVHNTGLAATAARNGDFEFYLKEAPQYYDPIKFMQLENGAQPQNLDLIKYEEITSLNEALQEYLKSPLNFSKRVNSSKRDDYVRYIVNSHIETLVYNRYRILFDQGYYTRLSL